jgi:hypothetical protein
VQRPFNFTIYPYSKISRLPKFLQRPALILKNLAARSPKYKNSFDGIATMHNLGFLSDPRFIVASKRAIQAGGFDYGIPLRIHQAIRCADKAIKLPPDSVFVELGTGKGYVMSAILSSLEFMKADLSKKEVYLFDTFESSATDFKSEQDLSLGRNIYYAESFNAVKENFFEFPNVNLVKGRLPATLMTFELEKIGLLHIDLNAPEIETQCLRILWNRILPGGVVLIDDYAYSGFEYTYKLFNELAKELGVQILTTASGQGIIVK